MMSKFAKGMYLLGIVVAASALYFLIFEASDYLDIGSETEINTPPTPSDEEKKTLETGSDGNTGSSENETTTSATDPDTTAGNSTTDDSTTVKKDEEEETYFPHLEIVGAEVEPIPYVLEPGPYNLVCDYFRIRVTFTIRNIGWAAFPPEGVYPSLANNGYLLWTVLYNGTESEVNETKIYQPHLVTWNYSEIQYKEAIGTIPPQGTTTIEREFRAALDHPLNPFQIIAWFHPPVTTPAGSSKIGRTQDRGTTDSQPVEGSRLDMEIPSSDAPVIQIQQTTTTPPGEEQIILQLEQAPFVSEGLYIDGPDFKPTMWFYREILDKPGHYDTGVIFKNLGATTAGSVKVSFSLPVINQGGSEAGSNILENGIIWFYQMSGIFPEGRYAVIACDRMIQVGGVGADIIPATGDLSVSVNLRCHEESSDFSTGDVDLSNDVIKGSFTEMDYLEWRDEMSTLSLTVYPEEHDPDTHTHEWLNEQVEKELENLLNSCDRVEMFGCDSGEDWDWTDWLTLWLPFMG